MVTIKQKFTYLPNGEVNLEAWLHKNHLNHIDLIIKATQLTQKHCKGLTTFYGQPCIEQGLEMAEIILHLKLDSEAIAAAVIATALQHANLSLEIIQLELGENVAKISKGIQQMNAIHIFQKTDHVQLDRMRKLLLAMVADIRVVLIKLAERVCLMRGIKKINPAERKRLAQETMDIYAPLANRLGIGQIKWELEDLAFRYKNPVTYKTIAQFLAERREDREQRIQNILLRLKQHFSDANLTGNVSGRAKHIYSIYLKMRQKDLDFNHIYDYSAVRIIVPSFPDCYTALSIVHHLWEHIPEEFDDYIANPKPNGYRSIHTAVIDPDGKNFEIQIRSKDMHDEAERGVAAHWLYKEKTSHDSSYDTKITFLRQLLDWHKDVSKQATEAVTQLVDENVYVFSPAGDILDLPRGATPVDFAYHVHSALGHRCRGAKVNSHIVPLTYALQTGDKVEILTIPQGDPSRDWLNAQLGYVKTARARAKIAQWFRHQDQTQYIESGKRLLEREFTREKIHTVNLQQIATRLNFKTDESLLSALGSGSIRPAQVLHVIKTAQQLASETQPTLTFPSKKTEEKAHLQISGVNDLLTRIAKCCKPIPGDIIIGYITHGRGVTVHKKECNNITHIIPTQANRLLEVNWDNKKLNYFYVDLQMRAHHSAHLLKDVTATLSNDKIDLISLNSVINKKNSTLSITMTIQIHNVTQLKHLITQLTQLPNVLDIRRISE